MSLSLRHKRGNPIHSTTPSNSVHGLFGGPSGVNTIATSRVTALMDFALNHISTLAYHHMLNIYPRALEPVQRSELARVHLWFQTYHL